MITMQETLGVDAARSAFAFNNVAEFNSRIDWNIIGPALAVLFIILLVMIWHKDTTFFLLKNNPITRWRGRRRMEKAREAKVREIISDNVQDAIDDAFLEKDITAEERQWMLYEIGKAGFPDLHNRSMREKAELEAKRKEEPAKEGTLSTVHVL